MLSNGSISRPIRPVLGRGESPPLDARRGRAVETRILAQDFSAEGRRELEAEFGADAARSVIEDVKSGRGSADRS